MIGAKICGLTTPEAVASAVDGGAAFLGFMFFANSPRDLTPSRAADLADPARGRAKIVAVTVDAGDAELDAIVAALSPDLVQLHGRETPDRVADVRKRFGVDAIKVLPVAARADLSAADAYAEVADHLMFDAKAPRDADRPGGLGASFDWSLLDGVTPAKPWLLAGGLHCGNVCEAVRITGAPMVDVSSGVESAPGLKDPALIAAFLDAVKAIPLSPRERGDQTGVLGQRIETSLGSRRSGSERS